MGCVETCRTVLILIFSLSHTITHAASKLVQADNLSCTAYALVTCLNHPIQTHPPSLAVYWSCKIPHRSLCYVNAISALRHHHRLFSGQSLDAKFWQCSPVKHSNRELSLKSILNHQQLTDDCVNIEFYFRCYMCLITAFFHPPGKKVFLNMHGFHRTVRLYSI